jgi:hypothetical protein
MSHSFKYEHCYQAAVEGDLAELRRMHEAGLPLEVNIIKEITYETITLMPTINFKSTTEAASNGHLDCLVYAHENGCEWDWNTTSMAARHGHLDCLRYAHENGCPMDRTTTSYAYLNGHLNCIVYAHKNGCYVDVNCMRYSYLANGSVYKKEESERKEAFRMTCLRYAFQQGCPYNTEDPELIKRINTIKKNIENERNRAKILLENTIHKDILTHVILPYF